MFCVCFFLLVLYDLVSYYHIEAQQIKNHLFIAKTNEWILAPFILIHTTPCHIKSGFSAFSWLSPNFRLFASLLLLNSTALLTINHCIIKFSSFNSHPSNCLIVNRPKDVAKPITNSIDHPAKAAGICYMPNLNQIPMIMMRTCEKLNESIIKHVRHSSGPCAVQCRSLNRYIGESSYIVTMASLPGYRTVKTIYIVSYL